MKLDPRILNAIGATDSRFTAVMVGVIGSGLVLAALYSGLLQGDQHIPTS
jgi:hypothetical protein